MDDELRDKARPATRLELVLSIVAFGYLATCLGLLWLALKAAPAIWLLAPLLAHATAAGVRADKARQQLGAISLWCAFALATIVAVYGIAIGLFSPAERSDGHPGMPLGQMFMALVGGPPVGCLIAWRFGRRVPSRSIARDRLLFAVLGVLAVLAVYRNL